MSYWVTPLGKTPDTWSTRTSAWPCPIQAPCGHGLALLTLPLNAQLVMPRPYCLRCPPPGSLDSSGLKEASPPAPPSCQLLPYSIVLVSLPGSVCNTPTWNALQERRPLLASFWAAPVPTARPGMSSVLEKYLFRECWVNECDAGPGGKGRSHRAAASSFEEGT